jgi:hypothetical protein
VGDALGKTFWQKGFPYNPFQKLWTKDFHGRNVRANFDLSLCSHKPCAKVFVPLFSKRGRVWAEPTKTAFLFCKLFSLRLLPAKKKAAMDAEKPRGYSRLASSTSLPAFSFDERCAKEKANKKKTLVYGAPPHAPLAFEKARQNFCKKFARTKCSINPNLAQGWPRMTAFSTNKPLCGLQKGSQAIFNACPYRFVYTMRHDRPPIATVPSA